MKRSSSFFIWFSSFMCLHACDGSGGGGLDEGEVEDLTIVVEADKSRILEEEEQLQRRRASVEEETARLAREKAEIAERLSSLSQKDRKQREELEAEQRRLAENEKRLRQQAAQFDEERNKLAQEKNQLLERISRMTQTKGGLTIAQREEFIAQRERKVAKREAEVALREKEVALREAEAAQHLRAARGLVDDLKQGSERTVIVNQVAPAPSSQAAPATRSQATRARRGAEAKMEAKGILPADLGASGQDLFRQANAAWKAKDYGSSTELFNQLATLVDSTQVNRDFVKGKFDRLNREFPNSGQDERVQGLLNEASMFFTDGRWSRANKKINQIIATLGKK